MAEVLQVIPFGATAEDFLAAVLNARKEERERCVQIAEWRASQIYAANGNQPNDIADCVIDELVHLGRLIREVE